MDWLCNRGVEGRRRLSERRHRGGNLGLGRQGIILHSPFYLYSKLKKRHVSRLERIKRTRNCIVITFLDVEILAVFLVLVGTSYDDKRGIFDILDFIETQAQARRRTRRYRPSARNSRRRDDSRRSSACSQGRCRSARPYSRGKVLPGPREGAESCSRSG